MPLSDHLTRCPIPFDPDCAAAVPDLGLCAPLKELLAGAAGCSPHLAGLIARESDWLIGAVEAPDIAIQEELTRLSMLEGRDLSPGLRQGKRRIALLAALADLGGAWSLEQVTGALTDLADTALRSGLRWLIRGEIARARLPGQDLDQLETAAGMVVLAMGKMGAHELNYSSDIDVICLFDDSRYEGPDVMEARSAFIRVTRGLMALLSDITADGYVFRTDLRLRPDASVMPVCLSMEAAERYYESVGRTWERAAYIKARPAAGDLAAGGRFLDVLTPFVWRRYLDFAAIRDAHDMRLRIKAHKGLHRLELAGHDMKLGAGGIREIEFFTQTRQLIAGGRDPALRVRGTVKGLARLAEGGWVDAATRDALTSQYRAHRLIEHRVQMIQDARTHHLPQDDRGFRRLAFLCGESDVERFKRRLLERLRDVAARSDAFFVPRRGAGVDETPDGAEAVMDRWPGYPALRSPRAVESFARLKGEILSKLTRATDSTDALNQFDAFLKGLPAGVQLFALFEANPPLVDLLVDICATAPALARYLSRNAGVLDAVIAGAFFAPWPGDDALSDKLSRLLKRIPDYEARLDAARRWNKDWRFRIGVHHLRGLISGEEAGGQYADLANATLRALWPVVCDEFARKHGIAPGRGAMVLGMGSLGAGRLHAVSDLDLIVIYDMGGADRSDGPRPLSVRSYFARLTQAMVTAVSAPMAEGKLYEIDMRLRPSGRQGPIATALNSFRDYQRTHAWTWEHLALTRARPIVGNAGLVADVEAIRRAVLATPRDAAVIATDVMDMRRRLAEAKPGDGAWDAKAGPGRLMDIELFGQTLALLAASPERVSKAHLTLRTPLLPVPKQMRNALHDTHARLLRLHQALRLLTHRTIAVEALGAGAREFLLREMCAVSMKELAEKLAKDTEHVAHLIAAALADAARDADMRTDGGSIDDAGRTRSQGPDPRSL
ncbi:MAG: glutamine-synthetase adenylyltransferase [Pseudomonadota bacterium]